MPTTPQITAASLLCFLPATWCHYQICNYLFLLEKYDGERKYCTNCWAKRFLVAKVGPLVVVSMGRAAKRNAQSSIFLLYNTMLWVADRFRKRQESGSGFAPTVFKVQQTSWRNLGRHWSAAGAALFCTSTNGQSESVAIDSHVQMSNLGKMVFAPYKILLWKM